MTDYVRVADLACKASCRAVRRKQAVRESGDLLVAPDWGTKKNPADAGGATEFERERGPAAHCRHE